MTKTLGSIQTTPADSTAVQLVREYARLLDEALDLSEGVKVYSTLGPKMLAALNELGATPAARRGADRPTGDGAAPADGRAVVVELRGRARSRRATGRNPAAS